MAFNFPNAPVLNDEFTPAGGPTYKWDGAAWLALSSAAGGITISDTPPANPVHEDQWWESDTGNTYIYFDDGTSAQWVQQNVSPPTPALPKFIQKRIFATSQPTITLHPETLFFQVEVQGGGGGGGNAGPTTVAGQGASGSGGGSGGYCSKWILNDPALIPACVIGAGGAALTAGGNSSYTDGVNTLSAAGGGAGIVGGVASAWARSGGLGGTASGGELNCAGNQGGAGFHTAVGTTIMGVTLPGGNSRFGGGGPGVNNTGAAVWHQNSFTCPAGSFGAGTAGGLSMNGGAMAIASTAHYGVVIITEFR